MGRTQELLYFIREMKEQNLVKSVPNFTVVVDSPLAGEATRIFSGDLHGYLDEEAIAALKGGALFQFPGLTITREQRGVQGPQRRPRPQGDHLRLRHVRRRPHPPPPEAQLWRPECAIVFVGYQAEGSLGRRLLNGVSTVKLFGEEIAVRAKIVRFHGLSSHADRDGLLRWIEGLQPQAPAGLRGSRRPGGHRGLRQHPAPGGGWTPTPPTTRRVYDLLTNRMLSPGLPPEKKAGRPGRRLPGRTSA